jgi:hypothetical protein
MTILQKIKSLAPSGGGVAHQLSIPFGMQPILAFMPYLKINVSFNPFWDATMTY